MITKIDKTNGHLVQAGKIILFDVEFLHYHVGTPRLVEKVSGQRIYVRRTGVDANGGIEVGNFESEHHPLRLVRFVCDTLEEAWKVYEFDASLAELRAQEMQKVSQRFGEIWTAFIDQETRESVKQ